MKYIFVTDVEDPRNESWSKPRPDLGSILKASQYERSIFRIRSRSQETH